MSSSLRIVKGRAACAGRASARSRLPLAVRASGPVQGPVAVTFKLHRHVEYGQQVLLVGSTDELGAWDPKGAKELNWGNGDVWSADCSLPAGTPVEYKYIVRRREGLDWCPGQNKAMVVPAAASVEVADNWDSNHNSVNVLQAADAAEAADAPAANDDTGAAEVVQAPVVAQVAVASHSSEHAAPDAPIHEIPVAVSTVENVDFEEHMQPPAAPTHSAPTHGGSYVANNILTSAPMGAVAVGADPITNYEEADKFEVVEVGGGDKSSAATATAPAATATRAALSANMTASQLKTECKRRGLSSMGSRRELITRLQGVGAM